MNNHPPIPARRSHARRAGFTLLEVLLALGMVAVVSLTMYMCMTVALRARDSAAAAVGPVRAASIAADLMRQDLESVQPPTGQLAGDFIGTRQQGGGANAEADSLQFYCIGNDAGNDSPIAEGMRRVELGLTSEGYPNPTLVRRVTRNLLAQVEPDPDEEILCRNVQSFALRYYDGTDWQEQWDSSTLGNVLPLAVEMTIDIITPPRPGQQQPGVYRMTKIVPLACGKLADTTGAATGGAQ